MAMANLKVKARGLKGALGVAALCYVAVDYLRIVSPDWHERLRPPLWGFFALAAASRAPFYPHWNAELRSAATFVACLIFMLAALVVEAISVQFVTATLGLDWHWSTHPLPDTGQWLLLALNEKLPSIAVEVLRAPLIGLHHYLMLFIMLGFSVLFGCVKAPGLGLGARYMFTMGVGRLLRVLTFVSTILPSARPWCARARFKVPNHPHPWAQKYYVPYASDSNAIFELLNRDSLHAPKLDYPPEYVPNWGVMSFLIDLLRPLNPDTSNVGEESWFNTLKRAGGGCNDLVYSGHILVSVLTAMAWTEAYPGWTAGFIWLLVLHSAQREIRERHHYSVDVVVGIYVGILLWKMTHFIWSNHDKFNARKLEQFSQKRMAIWRAAKDGDIDAVRACLDELDKPAAVAGPSGWTLCFFGSIIIVLTLSLGLLAFTWTADG